MSEGGNVKGMRSQEDIDAVAGLVAEEQGALEVGSVYLVGLDDCCVSGLLRGAFLRYEGGDVERARFDFGVVDGIGWKAYPAGPSQMERVLGPSRLARLREKGRGSTIYSDRVGELAREDLLALVGLLAEWQAHHPPDGLRLPTGD